jgi:PAS domain S-box-containing protein
MFAYALMAGLWFALSDAALAWLLTDPTQRALTGTLKDAAFVGITAALLYALLRRALGRQQKAFAGEQAALREQDRALRLLRALADSTTDAIFAKDREGRYLLFNRAAAQLIGTTVSNVLGRDDGAIFPPEQAAMIRAHDERVMAQGRAQTFEEEVDTAGGRLAFSATKGPLHDAQGEVVGMFGISRDITERLAGEALLRASEQRYRMLFDANPQPMWVFDRETLRFLAVNDAAVLHYGYTREEFLAMTIADIRPPEERDRLASKLAAQSEGLHYAGTWTHRCKDSRLTEAEVSSNGLTFDGRPARLVLAHDVTMRRELERQNQSAREAALAASTLLNDVLARVEDGLVGLDRDWRYTYLNARAARMLGRDTPQDLLGKHIWTEFPEGIGQPFQRAYEEAMKTQQPVVFEDHYHPWGLWFESRIYPSPDGLSIYFTDVTTRKRAEEALQLSESRFRLAAAGGQVWDWNVADGVVDFPSGFWQQLGCAAPPASEYVERFEGLMHPDDVPRWHRTLREHLIRRAPYQLEYQARHAGGDWRWFHTQGQAVWDAAGRATYMAGTTFDITERKRAEAALRESEAYRRSLFEQLGDGVLLLDREQHVLDANPQALAMLGYSRDELLRLVASDLLPAFEHGRVDEDIRKVMSGQPHLAEWDFLRKDGSHFSVEANARRLDDRRFIAVIRDITLRRASQFALLTYQLELSELAQRLLSQEKMTTQRVAQTLHDGLGQTLAAARLTLDASLSVFGATMPAALKAQSQQILVLLEQAVREVRQVLNELRPPLLDDQGLAGALENEIGARAIVGGADVLLEVSDADAAQRWPGDVEYGAFMVAREAIANARQHAGASLIRVMLGSAAGSLSLDVLDDGCGIPASVIHGRPGHLGIVGMRERAIAIGAHFAVDQGLQGGTRVTLRWEPPVP